MKDLYNVLDKGFIRVVDKMGGDSGIVQAARVSYGDGTKHVSQDRSLIRYLLRHKHTSPFEMCVIKLHLKMPIFIARQWIRHRMASINEYSARYSVMKDEFYIPSKLYGQCDNNKQSSSQKEIENSQEIIKKIQEHSEKSYKLYQELLESGVARETARIVLPTNIYTEFYWQINLHNLLNFVRLRSHNTAQYEIRAYSEALEEILKEWVPMVHEAFENYIKNGISFSEQTKQFVRIDKSKSNEELSKTESIELDKICDELLKY